MLHHPLHHRQFILGPRPIDRTGWSSRTIQNGTVLSTSEALPVKTAVDQLARQWILLGFAVQTEPGAPDPIEALDACTGDVEQVMRTWSGRWALIGSGVLYTDAASLLGCYYRRIENGPDTGLWASSSVALLAELKGTPPLHSQTDTLDWGSGVDWYPPPSTRWMGIRQLFPSQALRFEGVGAVLRRSVPEPHQPERNTEEILGAVEERLVTTMRNIAESSDGTPWIALTGGRDSRLLLAAAHAADIDVRTFTQERELHRWKKADRMLPPLLSHDLGYEHQLIKAEPLDRGVLGLWDEHTAGQSVEADRVFLARRQWEAIPERSTVLRAGVFETAQDSEHTILPSIEPGSEGMMDSLAGWAAFYGKPLTDDQTAALSEWVEWINEDVDSTMDWRDRFYMEQRVGGWLSAVEQGLDLTGRPSLHPANGSALLSDLLAFDPELRATARHHELLIERMAPTLLRYPFNPPDPLPRRIVGKVIRESFRLRQSNGVRDYVATVTSRLKRL